MSHKVITIVLLFLLSSCDGRLLRSNDDTSFCDTSKSIIVMSYGRSGSTYVCDILQKNFPYHDDASTELLGHYYDSMHDQDDPLGLVRKRLCAPKDDKSGEYRGFKWMPSNWEEKYYDVLEWVARRQIPVVFNYRNPIDQFLSKRKHSGHRDLPAHCKPGDEKCIEAFIDSSLIEVDVKQLLSFLKGQFPFVSHEEIFSILITRNVNFFPIAYESLIGEQESALRAWREIFEFIDPSRNWDGLTNESIASDNLAVTSSESHRDKIKNYEEVRAALRGTRFAPLLN